LFKSRQPENTGDLQVGIFQTGAAATPLGSAPIVSVALDFKVGNWMFPGTPVNLASTNGKTSMYLDGQKTEQPITLGIGTLTAQ
jgi:hypothetical protein